MIRVLLQTLLGAEVVWIVFVVNDAVDTYGAGRFFGVGAFFLAALFACWWVGAGLSWPLPTWPTPRAEGRKETR